MQLLQLFLIYVANSARPYAMQVLRTLLMGQRATEEIDTRLIRNVKASNRVDCQLNSSPQNVQARTASRGMAEMAPSSCGSPPGCKPPAEVRDGLPPRHSGLTQLPLSKDLRTINVTHVLLSLYSFSPSFLPSARVITSPLACCCFFFCLSLSLSLSLSISLSLYTLAPPPLHR